MALQNDLVTALASWGVATEQNFDANTSLIKSGLIDSVALFNLSVWVEEQLGRPVDPTAVDLLNEWDTVAAIVAFVEKHRAAPASEVQPTAPLTATPEPTTATATPLAIDTTSTDGDYEIVRYSPRFKDAIATLQKNLWSPDPLRNRAMFEWKYELNPFAGEPLVYLALHKGEPVAMRGFCGSLWESGVGAPPACLYSADDLIIGEAHRNHGLFATFTRHALADLAARGQKYFLSLSALRVTRLQALASGSRSVGTLNPVGRLSWWAAAEDRIKASLERIPGLWRLVAGGDSRAAERAFAALDRATPGSIDGMKFSIRREPGPDAMADLVSRLGHDGRLRHVRDRGFFAWRYSNPMHEYRFVLAEAGERLAGYLILQRGISEYANKRRVNIVDWEAEDAPTAEALLKATLSAAHFPELVTWSESLRPDRLELLRRLGFRAIDTENTARGLPCVLVRAVAQPDGADWRVNNRSLLDIAQWDLRMAYTTLA